MFRYLLIVGEESPALQRALPFLRRAELQIHHAPDPAAARELVETTQFDLVLVRFPSPELDLTELVRALRSTSALSRNAALLVLTDAPHVETAGGLLGQGYGRVVNLDDPEDSLLHAVAKLIEVAPRRTMRVIVQIDLLVRHDTRTSVAMTENISTSGMLVRCDSHDYPIGAKLRFELALPDGGPAIGGEAEVIRHATSTQELFDGIGARFIGLGAEEVQRLEAFVAKRTQG